MDRCIGGQGLVSPGLWTGDCGCIALQYSCTLTFTGYSAVASTSVGARNTAFDNGDQADHVMLPSSGINQELSCWLAASTFVSLLDRRQAQLQLKRQGPAVVLCTQLISCTCTV